MDGILANDFLVYSVIGILTFAIGLIIGYILLQRYYMGRFVSVAQECSEADSLVPLIGELERES